MLNLSTVRVSRSSWSSRAPTIAGSASACWRTRRHQIDLYLPFNDPDACYQMVQEFGDRKGVVGFMVTSTHYRKNYENPYMRTLCGAAGARPAARLPRRLQLGGQSLAMTNRFIAVHGLGFTWSNMCTWRTGW